ncbi:EAL domain-containing response regulator [Thiocystis violascens]|uniref:EAL domain-containing protein n=1 Tax=Thiocystis violascens (strain ATCC 17096 / DSM 198 / 6111) TaxID=765911 RepID=I3Y6K2_THIV6|nr:EAL domain-containing protein [Thiocystis violascens]AFL72620.1 EAL domain-containing protein [Thiocystis violascens DSM 198]
MHILYLDDEPRMESTLRRLVQRQGHGFEFCASIKACKTAVAAKAPDLLLLDLGLAQESGLDVIDWLADERIPLPVVFLSGYGDDLLDTAQRIAKSRGVEIRGLVSKALLASDLMPLLDPPPVGSPHRLPSARPDAADTSIIRLNAAVLAERIEAGGVEPFFQPIVSLMDGRPCGVEVLARLRLADGSLIDAADFIPLAEASGLIAPMTRALFRRIIALKERLRPLYLDFLAVNLSRVTIEQLDVVDVLQPLVTELKGYCHVIVEVTETAVCHDRHLLQTAAAQIQLQGASLAIDDFGTGYASLRDLAEFPITILKIDASFVSEMFESMKAMTVLMAIIGLGQRLGLKMIAKGVETEAQRDLLFSAGLEFAQGYLFGRPGELAAIERMIAASRLSADGSDAFDASDLLGLST